jgi:methylase of polypeptide subunit release factors
VQRLGTKENKRGIASRSWFAVAILLALAACSNPNAHWEVPHPGKYTLTYYPETPGDATGRTKTTVGEREFYVPNGTVRPSAQSMYLLSHWKIKDGEEVLDIGTGSGVQAVFAAEKAERVVATDISLSAVNTAIFNAQYNGFRDKIEVRAGDLFAPLKAGERFDVILFNIDYPAGPGTDGLWKVHQRFFDEVSNYLKPGGRIYYQIGAVQNIATVEEMARNNQLRIVSIRMDIFRRFKREPIVFVLFRESDIALAANAQDPDY